MLTSRAGFYIRAFFALATFVIGQRLFGDGPRRPGEYHLTADSLVQPDVPPGKLEGPFIFKSQILRGTVRRYWIFVPAEYTAAHPACLLVFHDGQRATNPQGPLRVQNVLANLVHQKAIPITIGLFITPGQLGESYPDNLGMGNPNHRAEEYDALTTDYTRFLVDEMLPEISKKYRITNDPQGRIIGGTSSGAICAFTVAWNRPDQFRNVISMIGSFVGIGYHPATSSRPVAQGGDLYPTLIRKNPVKPLTIFMQDGSNDLNNEHGNWFLSSQQMLSALEWANSHADQEHSAGSRYRLNHVWGDGAHSDDHGGSLLPDILRWIWQDYRPAE